MTLSRDEDTRRPVDIDIGYGRQGPGVRVDQEKLQTFENGEPGDHYVVPIMRMDAEDV